MSAALYRKVWTEDGSPLLHATKRQAEGLERGLAAPTSAGAAATLISENEGNPVRRRSPSPGVEIHLD